MLLYNDICWFQVKYLLNSVSTDWPIQCQGQHKLRELSFKFLKREDWNQAAEKWNENISQSDPTWVFERSPCPTAPNYFDRNKEFSLGVEPIHSLLFLFYSHLLCMQEELENISYGIDNGPTRVQIFTKGESVMQCFFLPAVIFPAWITFSHINKATYHSCFYLKSTEL